MSRVTLKDVAAYAGVSHQTVSNVLNNRSEMRSDTRERVLEAIQALDYHPNQAAKALREARVTTLCCALYDHQAEVLGDPYRNQVQSAVMAEANGHGYDMTTALVLGGQPHTLEALRQRFMGRLFGGLILVGTTPSVQQVQQIQSWGLPVVLFDHTLPGLAVCSVDADYKQGMTALVEHHVARGRSRLALILPQQPGSSTQARQIGFLTAAQRLGVQTQVIGGDWTYESGEAAMHQLWNSAQPPQAVLAGNDRMAAGALRAAHDLGLRVPEDVAISGFDDTEFARYTQPGLTTVHVPHAEMARQAVRQLLKLLSHQQAESVLFPVSLVVRGSA